MRLLVIGGSDAGISAGLRARELDPGVEVTLVVADAYPKRRAARRGGYRHGPPYIDEVRYNDATFIDRCR